ncbi:kynureninase [Nafulsella turpanensis]|uniref:kynureninase n=1 Tax=Nafulsella turpanensis TaxID=1265690 RepID=UPI00034CA231|nr:kynureninase [Nafulsella turpanensis]
MINQYQSNQAYAREQDARDPLRQFREQFIIPPAKSGGEAIYFCGNSLGLQPKNTRSYLDRELEKWATYAVDGHFHAPEPWLHYHRLLKEPLARIVGAKPEEVVVMNNLSSNLHFLMVSFYQPTTKRYKVLMEGGAFPSDQYAVESQVKFRGYTPEEAIVEVFPREGEQTLRTEDILAAIEQHQDELALVLFAGLQYYTGQVFDMAAITKAGQAAGAKVGFDLAHAAGNVPLQLHDWGVDFAAWCSYKYLNSGPGSNSGIFVHERYANQAELPRFAGWWGHDEKERFLMQKGFKPMYGADGWQLSNGNILPLAAQRASLEIFEQAGMDNLRQKSIQLTGYLEYLIREEVSSKANRLQIITPSQPEERGCQLSLFVEKNGKQLFEQISQAGVVGDWREPNVIRVAPTPLYNTFTDVFQFAQLLKKAIKEQ